MRRLLRPRCPQACGPTSTSAISRRRGGRRAPRRRAPRRHVERLSSRVAVPAGSRSGSAFATALRQLRGAARGPVGARKGERRCSAR
eukprot:5175448-Prymnesium_polylepis.1